MSKPDIYSIDEYVGPMLVDHPRGSLIKQEIHNLNSGSAFKKFQIHPNPKFSRTRPLSRLQLPVQWRIAYVSQGELQSFLGLAEDMHSKYDLKLLDTSSDENLMFYKKAVGNRDLEALVAGSNSRVIAALEENTFQFDDRCYVDLAINSLFLHRLRGNNSLVRDYSLETYAKKVAMGALFAAAQTLRSS